MQSLIATVAQAPSRGPDSRTGGMRFVRGRRMYAAIGTAFLLASGCALHAANTIRKNFIGMAAGEIRSCLGVAQFFDSPANGSEVWGYVRPYPGKPADVEIGVAVGPGTAFKRPTVEAGEPTERKGTLEQSTLGQLKPGNCVYLFRLENGQVTTVSLRGRTFNNLNADDECTIAIRRCMPADGGPK